MYNKERDDLLKIAERLKEQKDAAYEEILRLQENEKRIERIVNEQKETIVKLSEDNQRLRKWTDDLQSGMYINCAYCGHRYEKQNSIFPTMQEILTNHIENCRYHPMFKLKKENKHLKFKVKKFEEEGGITEFYKKYPDYFIEDFLGLKLYWYQKAMLRIILSKKKKERLH